MNRNLLFFCSMCREKATEEIEKLKCTIDHKIKHFKKGELIASQGASVSYLYMLTNGKAKSEIISDSGVIISMEEVAAPYPLTAAFLFADNNNLQVDIVAMEDCEIILISKIAIEKQIAKCPGFLRGFMAFAANHAQFLSDRLKIFSQKGIKAKIAYYILQHEKSMKFELGRSITSLAEYFGVERPSLSRAISEMVKSGIIEYDGGKGKILNYTAIQELLG